MAIEPDRDGAAGARTVALTRHVRVELEDEDADWDSAAVLTCVPSRSARIGAGSSAARASRAGLRVEQASMPCLRSRRLSGLGAMCRPGILLRETATGVAANWMNAPAR